MFVLFCVVDDPSPYNIILGRAWLHMMKVIPFTYHQKVSFFTNQGQIDMYGDQKSSRKCYSVTIIEENSIFNLKKIVAK